MLSVLHRTAGPQYFRAVPVIHLAVPVRVCCWMTTKDEGAQPFQLSARHGNNLCLSSVWPSCSFVIEVTFVWVFMSSHPDKIKNTYSYSLSQAALQHLWFLDFFFPPFASFSMFDSSRWQLRLIISIYLQSAGSPYGRHAVMHNCTCGHPHTPTHTRTRCRFGSLPCRLIVWHLTRSQAIEF